MDVFHVNQKEEINYLGKRCWYAPKDDTFKHINPHAFCNTLLHE